MAIRLKGSTSGSVELDVPAAVSGGDVALTLPNGIGSAEQFLKNSGTAGELEFSSMVETSTGVGIGTSSPQAKLDVNGNAVIGTDNVGLVEFTSTGVPHFAVAADASNYRSTRINVVSAGGYADLSFDAMGTAAKTGLPSAGSLVGNIMYLDASTQNVGIGTSSPDYDLTIGDGSSYVIQNLKAAANEFCEFRFGDTASVAQGKITYDNGTDSLRFTANAAERLRIDSSGNVKIASEHLRFNTSGKGIIFGTDGGSNRPSIIGNYTSSSDNNIAFNVTGSERLRIDSSGRLLVGTTTEGQGSADNFTVADSGHCGISIRSGTTSEGAIYFSDGTSGNAEYRGYFLYDHDGDHLRIATGATERLRIDGSGNVFVGKTSTSGSVAGTFVYGTTATGAIDITRLDGRIARLNRQNTDGRLVEFCQANSVEGAIDISGGTTSFVGGHLSRWSQLAGGAIRTEILRGSVLSNLDEMCEWGEEDNEQLNRMKVSDVEGDKNVSGVFQSWDDDDDTYVNDFYCAMTGDFVIRIAQGTTVARGDLLMSAGDGTAKPQDDDIVRSKTIAKVTSTTVSETYSDNSYCVPCVLMAC